MSIFRFTLLYLLYNLLIVTFAFGLPFLFPAESILVDKFWVIYLFLAGITYIAYLTVYFGLKASPETGVVAIMGSIAVKMFFSMAFVLIYSLNNKGNEVIFALNFFSLYLLLSVFEISALLRNLRHQNK